MPDQPLLLRLNSPSATIETAGGKGASLAKLAQAGFPVPQGFHLTAHAYRRFVTETGIDRRIRALTTDIDATDPVEADRAATGIASLFRAETGMPGDVAAAIAEGYAELGDEPAVAVRSSATAEDLPEASFAGQMESYLNVRGRDALVEAIRRCWSSLWTSRAIMYRARHDIDAEVDLAVVVQLLVNADAAGVAFSANPITGNREQIVVNAGWGLGEALVDGGVTPDQYLVEADRIVGADLGDKAVATVPAANGTRREPVGEDRRHTAVLTEDEVMELAALTTRIAGHHRRPMDVEWARHDGRFAVLQARPITNLPEAREEWNDSLTGDYLWTAGNLGEAIPSVMTPMTWSLVQVFMSEAMALSSIGPHRLSGNIGGRFYMNMTVFNSAMQAIGLTKLAASANVEAFGPLPAITAPPRLPVPAWRLIRTVIPEAARFFTQVRRYQDGFADRIDAFPDRCRTARDRIAAAGTPGELRDLWFGEVDALLRDGSRLLAAGVRLSSTALVRIRPWLRKRADEDDINAILTGMHTESAGLASLGPLVGLHELANRTIDRETFAARWGHRCPDEFEVSIPRPAEDPEWIDRQLEGMAGVDVDELLERQRLTREAALHRFDERNPREGAKLRRRLADVGRSARGREAGRSETIRAFWVLRGFVLRAGELTGHGQDVFFLRLPELLDLLSGDSAAVPRVPARRSAYDHYRRLPVYPTFIRGRFDPEAWAADPHRRADLFDATGRSAADVDDRISGSAGSSGVVTATARVIESVEDAARLAPGEILVTKITNIGWTPVFPRAAAVVTDVGATLSHAAIVARELGIPAVVGCRTATTLIPDGATITVNGNNGTVNIVD